MSKKLNIRTAAIIYSEEKSSDDLQSIKAKVIESIFIENSNLEIELEDIDEVVDNYAKLKFSDAEIAQIIENENFYFVTRIDESKNQHYVSLSKDRYNKLIENSENLLISKWISEFIGSQYEGTLSADNLESALTKFIYELLNKNINAFSKILKAKSKIEEINVDPDIFSTNERSAINEFLVWENDDKNKALFGLIAYSVEYSMIANNIKNASQLINCVSNKTFLLDTNIIFRAIGLNGERRKRRMLEFLEKCFTNGQILKSSRYTFKEFRSTINHHIKQLEKSPFKKINPSIFNKTTESGIYEYYHNWRRNKSVYGFDLFYSHIMSEFDKLKSKFNIEDLLRLNYNDSVPPHLKNIEKYTNEIGLVKPKQFEESHKTDAQNIYLVEKLRENNNFSLMDTNYYMISSDQKLRSWDFERNEHQPIVLLPTQWMTILLKYCSRTSDDYKSFAQFLKLKAEKPIFSEMQLHAALSGISEITEDFETQESIFERIFETKAQAIIESHSNDYETIREQFRELAKTEADSKIKSLEEKAHKKEVENQTNAKEFKKQLLFEKKNFQSELKKKRYPIKQVAERKFNKHKFTLFGSIISFYLLIIFLIFKVGWDTMEPIVYILGVIGLLISFGYIFTQENTFSFPKYLANKSKEIEDQTFRDFRFDKEKYQTLANEISDLEKEIAD